MIAAAKAVARFVICFTAGMLLVLTAQIAVMAFGAPDFAGPVLFVGTFGVLVLSVRFAMNSGGSRVERNTAVVVGSFLALGAASVGLLALTGLLLLAGALWITGAADVAVGFLGGKIVIAAGVVAIGVAATVGMIMLSGRR